MDINKVLAELRKERDLIEEAMCALERLVRERGKRRGRPPAWLAEAAQRTARRRKPRASSAGEHAE